MEFSVDTSTFANALEQIQGAVDKKSTIPIACRLPDYADS
jgi:DNA polymerase III sliding clamp (beta) subunit (PCNA family)